MPCEDGEITCLPDGRPATCPDGVWVAGEACGAGLACSLGRCVAPDCAEAADTQSHMGCEFLAADLPNTAFAEEDGTTVDSPAAVVLVNPHLEQDAVVGIFDADGDPTVLVADRVITDDNIEGLPFEFEDQTVTSHVRVGGRIIDDRIAVGADIVIPPRGSAVLLLPRRLGPLRASSLRPNGFRVRSTAPVAAYQYSPYCCNFSFSNDASLLLPTHALGRRYVFTGVPLLTIQGFMGTSIPPIIAVIAAEDDTDVSMTLPEGARINAGEDGLAVEDGVLRTRMAAQDVLLVTGDSAVAGIGPEPYDFSGAEITANRDVAVFSAHLCANYPHALAACDALQDQLLPVASWAQSYALVPLAERAQDVVTEVIYWRISADVGGGARIRLSAPFASLAPLAPGYPMVPDCADALEGQTLFLGAGEHCEFGTKSPVTLTSNTPIQVTGTLVGQEATGLDFQDPATFGGDPALFVLPGLTHYRRNYAFTMPETYARGHLTIIGPANNVIRLNGQAINWARPNRVPESDLRYQHVDLSSGTHRIEADAPVGILIYGFDDFVSFAYPAGFQFPAR